MTARIRAHIRNNVVGYAALFIALSGTAYAIDGPLAGQNTVGTLDIIRGEVRTSDLGPKAVTADKIDGGAVGSAAVENASLTGVDIRDDTVISSDVTGIWGPDVIPDGLTGADVTDIRSEDVANESLTGNDAKDASLTGDDIAFRSIDTLDLAIGAVNSFELAPHAVDAGRLNSIDVVAETIQIGGGVAENGRWNTAGVQVLCPNPSTVLSGGAEWVTNTADLALATPTSAPVVDNNFVDRPARGWRAVGANDSGLTVPFKVWAVCLEG